VWVATTSRVSGSSSPRNGIEKIVVNEYKKKICALSVEYVTTTKDKKFTYCMYQILNPPLPTDSSERMATQSAWRGSKIEDDDVNLAPLNGRRSVEQMRKDAKVEEQSKDNTNPGARWC